MRTIALTVLLQLPACSPDSPDPGGTDTAAASTDTAPASIEPGLWAWSTEDVLVDECGTWLFDQELRVFNEDLSLAALADGEVLCDLDGTSVNCGPGTLGLPMFPGIEEVVEFSGTLQADGTLVGRLDRELSGGCLQSIDVAARPFAPTEELAPLPCSQEGGITSEPSSLQTRFDIVNERNSDIWVQWIDFDGNRASAEVVRPGDTWTAGITFVLHPFVVAESEDGACLAVVQPHEDYGVLTVGP